MRRTLAATIGAPPAHRGWLANALLSMSLLAALQAPPDAARAAEVAPARRETFSIDYVIGISPEEPGVARVRWDLSGGEEIAAFRFKAAKDRFFAIKGSGVVDVDKEVVHWRPGSPYGHLEYKVRIDHRRGEHFDSYAGNGWIIARARDFVPAVRLLYSRSQDGQRPRSRARLLFRLPEGWKSAAPHPSPAPGVYTLSSNHILSRPSGWIALGQLDVSHQEIDDVSVRIARVPGSKLPVDDVFAMLTDALPRLRKILRTLPGEILIVSAGDPMWRGGLSAQRSLFLHGDRPLRTPDKTSPVLHEMFHVAQSFRAGPDADWITEGLAEYYSLELQRRSGALTPKGFAKGLELFGRYGRWNVNLTQQSDNAATNNSAPLVMYALDQRIQRETAGKKRLDDVVMQLAENGGMVDTASFRAAVQKVSGKKLDKFFAAHVERGEMPHLEPAT